MKRDSHSSKASNQPVYLREVSIQFKKRRVKNGIRLHQPIDNSQVLFELFAHLKHETKEKLICVSLDSKLKIISFEVVAVGSINGLAARPLEVIRSAVALNAYAIVLVHNHPSGDPQPSEQDKFFTQAIFELAQKGKMNFCDHVIIGDGRYFSFAEEGLLHASGNE